MAAKSRTMAQQKTKEAYCFIVPAFIYMILVLGYPIVYNIILSLKDVNVKNLKSGTSVFVGLQNYIDLFHDPTFLLVLRNTFIFTIACLIFQFTIGFAFAMFFNQKFKLAGPIRGLILVSYMMPMAALIAVIIMNCWVGIPFNMLLLVSGLTSISPDVYESASMDGANWGQRFLFITLPLMKESILAVLMLGFIYTFRAFDLMYIMTAGGPLNSTDVLGTYSYMLSFTQFNFSKGAAVAMVLFACLFLIGLFYLKLLSKEEEEG